MTSPELNWWIHRQRPVPQAHDRQSAAAPLETRRPACSTRSGCRTSVRPRFSQRSCPSSSRSRTSLCWRISSAIPARTTKNIEILNDGEGIAAYELNVSCPNTAEGGLQFGTDPRLLDEVVTKAKRAARRPLIVKLSPNVTSIAQMAHIAQEAGADAISLVNTFTALAIDADTRKPRIANVTAGLSGPAIKPIALRMVHDAAHAVSIPVIGMGGISTAVDVAEFMLAGAAAVQIGTASYWDPCATEKIVDELHRWCQDRGVTRLADLTGGMILE